MQYHAIPCKTMQCHAKPCHTMHYHAISCNTMQNHSIQCNTMQYHACLITADGAYPCGQYMAIFLHFRRKSRFFSDLHWHCLHYHFICMSEPGQNGFLVLSYLMNNILSPREFIVLFRVYGFLAWWYWLYTSSWPSRSEFMPSCNFHKTSYKWYNILFF